MTAVISPVTGEPIADIAPTPVDEVDALIAKAHAAFATWREVSPGDRARLLRRFSQVIDDHLEELAQLEVANSGHTIGNARWEAGNVRDVLAYYAGNGATIEPADEQALRLAISQLESELARASAQADVQLAQLRRLATHQKSP